MGRPGLVFNTKYDRKNVYDDTLKTKSHFSKYNITYGKQPVDHLHIFYNNV